VRTDCIAKPAQIPSQTKLPEVKSYQRQITALQALLDVESSFALQALNRATKEIERQRNQFEQGKIEKATLVETERQYEQAVRRIAELRFLLTEFNRTFREILKGLRKENVADDLFGSMEDPFKAGDSNPFGL